MFSTHNYYDIVIDYVYLNQRHYKVHEQKNNIISFLLKVFLITRTLNYISHNTLLSIGYNILPTNNYWN